MTRTLPPVALGLLLGPLLLLAGCDQLSAPKAGPTASGEVLPGTVSDAMLNTDQSQAEAPLAPVANSAPGKDAGKSGAAASESAPDTSEETVASTVAETPSASEPKPKPATSPKPD